MSSLSLTSGATCSKGCAGVRYPRDSPMYAIPLTSDLGTGSHSLAGRPTPTPGVLCLCPLSGLVSLWLYLSLSLPGPASRDGHPLLYWILGCRAWVGGWGPSQRAALRVGCLTFRPPPTPPP